MPQPAPDTPTITERILYQCRDNIEGIRRADGYTTDVQSPVADKPFNAHYSTRLPSAGVSILTDLSSFEAAAFPCENRTLLIQVDGWIRERRTGSLKSDLERFIGDVYVAMTRDTSQGGIARDTKPQEILRVEHEAPNVREAGFSAVFQVDYHHVVNDPTTDVA